MSAAIRICSLFLLCSLLLANLQRAVDASGIQQPEHQQQHNKAKKSLTNWVQSYKEPKTNEQPEPKAEQEEEELSCTIKVQKVNLKQFDIISIFHIFQVEKHTGKCVRLRGGATACQTENYLDPVNSDCMFLD